MGRYQIAIRIGIFGFTIISILAILSVVYPIDDLILISRAQQEKKTTANTQKVSNQGIESAMGSFMSPKSLLASIINQSRNSTTRNNTTGPGSGIMIVRDSDTVLLSHQILLPKDFIHIYDSTGYKVTNGHLTAKLPCDTNFQSPVEVLVGQLTNLKPAKLEIVKELSKPGYMCMYHVILTHWLDRPYDATTSIGITLFNPSGYRVVMLNTSTVIVGVNELVSLSNKMQ